MSTEYRLTPTGRVTAVGTRSCKKCNRREFVTKRYEQSGDTKDLNMRYTLCKGLCVYCYNKPEAQGGHRKSNTESLNWTEEQLRARIAYLTDMLPKTTE